MFEISIFGLDKSLVEVLRRGMKISDGTGISIAWIRNEEDIAEINSKIILDMNFCNSDNELDILGKKYGKVIIPKINALFSLWQAFASHFDKDSNVNIFAGLLPRHDSHPFRIMPPEPAREFMRLFKEEAFGIYRGQLESFNVLSWRREIEIKIADFYQLEAVIFGALDRYFLYKIGKRFHRLNYFLLGRKGFTKELETLLKLDLIDCERLYTLLAEYEKEDIFVFQILIGNPNLKLLESWKVELLYDYSKRETAINKITVAFIRALLRVLKCINDEKLKTGVVWPISLFSSGDFFDILVKEIKNEGGIISYEELRYGYF